MPGPKRAKLAPVEAPQDPPPAKDTAQMDILCTLLRELQAFQAKYEKFHSEFTDLQRTVAQMRQPLTAEETAALLTAQMRQPLTAAETSALLEGPLEVLKEDIKVLHAIYYVFEF